MSVSEIGRPEFITSPRNHSYDHNDDSEMLINAFSVVFYVESATGLTTKVFMIAVCMLSSVNSKGIPQQELI